MREPFARQSSAPDHRDDGNAATHSYVREDDGLLMIAIAPHQFVNERAAQRLGLVRHQTEYSEDTASGGRR
jgi:hypothetical protein